jgi:hypothetical protein
METSTTQRTTRQTSTTGAARTYLDPVWHEAQEIWTADTIEELKDRLKHQEPHTRLETPWELVTLRRSRQPAIVVRRQVYCDPPGMDPMLIRICERWSNAPGEDY